MRSSVPSALGDQALCAYLAGLIDGDGSLLVRRRDRSASAGDRARGVSFILRVSIAGETEHINGLRSELSGLGNVWVRQRPEQRHLAEWVIAGGQARMLLAAVVPFLRLKRRQAEVMLAMPMPRSRWAATPELRHAQEAARVEVSRLNCRFGRGTVVAYGGGREVRHGG